MLQFAVVSVALSSHTFTVTYQGRVVRRPFAVGSKSQHNAVMLDTPDGSYVLRRKGGNAFRDPELDALVGKNVSVEGKLHNYTLIISDYHTLAD